MESGKFGDVGQNWYILWTAESFAFFYHVSSSRSSNGSICNACFTRSVRWRWCGIGARKLQLNTCMSGSCFVCALIEHNILKSPEVIAAVSKIDRAFYVPDGGTPYDDSPQSIGPYSSHVMTTDGLSRCLYSGHANLLYAFAQASWQLSADFTSDSTLHLQWKAFDDQWLTCCRIWGNHLSTSYGRFCRNNGCFQWNFTTVYCLLLIMIFLF